MVYSSSGLNSKNPVEGAKSPLAFWDFLLGTSLRHRPGYLSSLRLPGRV